MINNTERVETLRALEQAADACAATNMKVVMHPLDSLQPLTQQYVYLALAALRSAEAYARLAVSYESTEATKREQ